MQSCVRTWKKRRADRSARRFSAGGGKYDYKDSEGDTEHDSDKENFKWKDLSISMMTLTVGYHF